MRKKLSFLIVMAVSFILCARPLHVRADDGGDGGSGAGGSGAGGSGDGGSSDGGSSDGGSGDGGGTDSGSGTDSTGTDGTGNGGTDDTGADEGSDGDATTANDAPDAPSTDPSAVDEATTSDDLATDPALAPSISFAPATDPTTVTPVSPLDAIQSEATTDPRGGFNPINTVANGGGGLGPGGTLAGTEPVDVRINAVIVSAAQSPWDAVTRAPGVRNVIVTGGIVALGKTPIEGEIPGGGPQPTWLRLIPDLRLLNGSMIPPVVPNVIDIRIMSFPFEIEDPKPE